MSILMTTRGAVVALLAAAMALTAMPIANADTGPASFDWKGQLWDVSANADATVDGSGNAVLERTGGGTAQLHLNRIAPAPGSHSFINENGTPWVRFSYVDDGTSHQGIDLFVDDEASARNQRLQAGSLFSCDGLGYVRYDSEEEIVFGNNCGGTRTGGPHTVYVGQRPDGTIDYNFDGIWYTSTFIRDNAGPFDFNDIYLRWRGGVVGDTVTFTDFQYGDDHVSNKNACKKGGWQAGGVYKNQGDCVSRFAKGA